MNGMTPGQYIHGESFVHTLDPRTKIGCCFIIIVSVFINTTWYYLLAHFIFMLAAITSAGLPLKFIASILSKLKYIFVFTFVLQAFLTPGHGVLVFGQLSATQEGLTLGAVNIARLVILFLGSMVLLMTTSPLRLAAGIEYLLQPLHKLKIPVHNFTTILGISFRFLPTLLEEAATIKKAQKSRGAPFDSPQLRVRLKAYTTILIPLFEASLSRAADLGQAMDSRCFTTHPNKLRLGTLKMTGQDILVLLGMVAFLGAGCLI